MNDNVVHFNGVTRLDLPADRVLDAAKEAGVVRVLVIGELEDGSEYFNSSMADGPNALWALERAKKALLSVMDD